VRPRPNVDVRYKCGEYLPPHALRISASNSRHIGKVFFLLGVVSYTARHGVNDRVCLNSVKGTIMNRLISALAPAAIVLAASLGCGAAYAGDSQASAPTPSVSQPSDAATMQHALTRRDVYNKLVQAEKDGTMDRMNAFYFGS
jgi:hypothetical protein